MNQCRYAYSPHQPFTCEQVVCVASQAVRVKLGLLLEELGLNKRAKEVLIGYALLTYTVAPYIVLLVLCEFNLIFSNVQIKQDVILVRSCTVT